MEAFFFFITYINLHIPNSTTWCNWTFGYCCSNIPCFRYIGSPEKPHAGQHANLGCLLDIIINLIIKGKQLLETDISFLLRFQNLSRGPKGEQHQYNSSFVQNCSCQFLHFSRWRQWLAYNSWQNANNQHFYNQSSAIRICQQYHKSYLVFLFGLFFSK